MYFCVGNQPIFITVQKRKYVLKCCLLCVLINLIRSLACHLILCRWWSLTLSLNWFLSCLVVQVLPNRNVFRAAHWPTPRWWLTVLFLFNLVLNLDFLLMSLLLILFQTLKKCLISNNALWYFVNLYPWLISWLLQWLKRCFSLHFPHLRILIQNLVSFCRFWSRSAFV